MGALTKIARSFLTFLHLSYQPTASRSPLLGAEVTSLEAKYRPKERAREANKRRREKTNPLRSLCCQNWMRLPCANQELSSILQTSMSSDLSKKYLKTLHLTFNISN